MPKTTRARHRAAGRRAGSKKPRRETVSLIVRIPPPALARLKAVAAVRRLTPARVLTVALRLYERHLHGVLGR
jgi:hypothetical protein